MTQRNLAIRLSVTDAAKVKATLNDVGESGQRALKKVEDASRPASKALLALDGATGTLRGTFEGMTARLGPLGGALSRLGPAGLAAGAALGALTGIIAKGVQMQGEAEPWNFALAPLGAPDHRGGLCIAWDASERCRHRLTTAGPRVAPMADSLIGFARQRSRPGAKR